MSEHTRKQQETAKKLNTHFGVLSGKSYSVLNGRVVERQNKWNINGQTDWKTLFGRPAGPYKPPEPKPTQSRQAADIPMYGGGGGPAFPQSSLVQQGTYDNIEGTSQKGKPVNVVRRGQRATLNGKPVVADGNGKWLDASDPSVPMSERSEAGSYESGNRSATKPQPTAKPPKKRDGKGAASLSIPPSAAQPGTGPKGNEVGSDADPDTPGLQGPGAVKPGARVNANGLVSYGRDLSSLNQFTKDFTGGYELTDIKSAFQSNALPTTEAGAKQGHEGTRTNYSWDSEGEDGVWNEETGRIEPPTAPGTTGGKPENAQDGTSDKPDVAEKIRTVRMDRMGARQKEFASRPGRGNFGGEDQDLSKYVSPMYANKKRNEIRAAFLDPNLSSVKASVKANAIAGYGKDSDGNARFNYGGELVYAKDGMQQQAKNAAMMGQDPSPYLEVPATPDTQPDTPADSELSPGIKEAVSLTEAPMNFKDPNDKAMEFARTHIEKYKNK